MNSIIENFHKNLERNTEHQFIIKSLDNLRETVETRCSKITVIIITLKLPDITSHKRNVEDKL